jgi:DNA-binding protein Fis
MMDADSLVHTLGEDLFEMARRYWMGGNTKTLHAAIASFILQVLKNNQEQVRAESHGRVLPLAEIEKRHILAVLKEFRGNQVQAAAALGVDRGIIQRRLRKYGLRVVRFAEDDDSNR